MSANSARETDFGVLIGRFQPFHNGHLEVVRDALEKTERLMILVGSSNRPRTFRNPFSFSERAQMIWNAIDTELKLGLNHHRISVVPLPDRVYDMTGWIEQVQHLINLHATPFVRPSIGLFGHTRDISSGYLQDFPDWRDLTLPDGTAGDVNATAIRERYFSASRYITGATRKMMPPSTVRFLEEHFTTQEYEQVSSDHSVNRDYVKKWGKGPHVTADSVVLRAGRVLLIKRKEMPLRGTWALPGGFLEVDRGETLYQCATRELLEETQVDLIGNGPGLWMLPTDKERRVANILAGALRAQHTFDDPNRSERGRIITTAFGFDLGGGHLPKIEAADDAGDARWVPLSEIREDEMFDDHGAIIRKMLRLMETRS